LGRTWIGSGGALDEATRIVICVLKEL